MKKEFDGFLKTQMNLFQKFMKSQVEKDEAEVEVNMEAEKKFLGIESEEEEMEVTKTEGDDQKVEIEEEEIDENEKEEKEEKKEGEKEVEKEKEKEENTKDKIEEKTENEDETPYDPLSPPFTPKEKVRKRDEPSTSKEKGNREADHKAKNEDFKEFKFKYKVSIEERSINKKMRAVRELLGEEKFSQIRNLKPFNCYSINICKYFAYQNYPECRNNDMSAHVEKHYRRDGSEEWKVFHHLCPDCLELLGIQESHPQRHRYCKLKDIYFN